MLDLRTISWRGEIVIRRRNQLELPRTAVLGATLLCVFHLSAAAQETPVGYFRFAYDVDECDGAFDGGGGGPIEDTPELIDLAIGGCLGCVSSVAPGVSISGYAILPQEEIPTTYVEMVTYYDSAGHEAVTGFGECEGSVLQLDIGIGATVEMTATVDTSGLYQITIRNGVFTGPGGTSVFSYSDVAEDQSGGDVFVEQLFAGDYTFVGDPYYQVSSSEPFEIAVRTSLSLSLLEPVSVDTPPIATVPRIDRIAPNPFNPTTVVTFSASRATYTIVRAFDSRGRLVADLFAGSATGEEQVITWDAEGVPSGVYFVEVRSAGARAVKKTVLLK